MKYIIIQSLGGQSSNQRATEFTRELFKVSRPVADASDVTLYLFGLIQHPTSGEWAMQVDMSQTIYVSPSCNLNKLKALLNPSQADPGEVAEIITNIENKKGGHVVFNEIIPSYVSVKTHAEMDALGWFPVITLN